jgi:hypothetical protein
VALKKYSKAIKRSIRTCKNRNLSSRDAATYINTLKCVKKTGHVLTAHAVSRAYKREDIIG